MLSGEYGHLSICIFIHYFPVSCLFLPFSFLHFELPGYILTGFTWKGTCKITDSVVRIIWVMCAAVFTLWVKMICHILLYFH